MNLELHSGFGHFAIVVGMVMVPTCSFGDGQSECKTMNDLMRHIEEVDIVNQSGIEWKSYKIFLCADNLSDYEKARMESNKMENVIVQLTNLLSSDIPAPHYIVMTLGKFGDRAKSSVPALLDRLQREEAREESIGTATGISEIPIIRHTLSIIDPNSVPVCPETIKKKFTDTWCFDTPASEVDGQPVLKRY